MDVYLTDTTTVVNNIRHSLFSQCNVILNGTAVTQANTIIIVNI